MDAISLMGGKKKVYITVDKQNYQVLLFVNKQVLNENVALLYVHVVCTYELFKC